MRAWMQLVYQTSATVTVDRVRCMLAEAWPAHGGGPALPVHDTESRRGLTSVDLGLASERALSVVAFALIWVGVRLPGWPRKYTGDCWVYLSLRRGLRIIIESSFALLQGEDAR